VSGISTQSDGLEPEAPDPADPVWDACDWLRDLRIVPAGSVWPRLMTGPHPRATGSWGLEYAAWAEERFGQPLRWWQRLVAARILEHDAAGALVWLSWLVSTARQVGKSWQLRGLAAWRLEQAGRFGQPQLVMHTGKDIPVCREVQRPMRSWARRHRGEGYDARESNGREEVLTPDGSQWLVRGRDSVYGYSVSLGLVDEAWDVAPEIVDDGLEPTMPSMTQPQLGLLSTAHRRATSLFPQRRALALDEVSSPVETLLIEWSARPDAENEDRVAWRAASPFWDERRERLLASTLARALAGGSDDPTEPDPIESFRTQWLNIWPARSARSAGRDEPLLEEGAWAGVADLAAVPSGGLVVAVEDRTGLGAAAAAAGVSGDGRIVVWGQLFPDRVRAVGWAAVACELRPGSRLLVGASLFGDESLAAFPAEVAKVGAAETSAALPKLRELLAGDRLRHDGGTELATQMAGLRVGERAGGLAVTSRGRSDLARCAAWAVHACAAAPPARPKWAML
jgi:hypothetical protein